MVRAIMHGCNGKMGQVITGLVRDDEQIEIVAGVDAYLGIEKQSGHSCWEVYIVKGFTAFFG